MTLSAAMRLQWKIRGWTVNIVTPSQNITQNIGVFDGTGMIPATDAGRKRYVTFHNGISFSTGPAIPSEISLGGGVFFAASVRAFIPFVAEAPQIYFNPDTGLYVPWIGLEVQIREDGSVGPEYTLGFATDPFFSGFVGGPDNATANFDGQTIILSGTEDGFGPVSALSYTPILW